MLLNVSWKILHPIVVLNHLQKDLCIPIHVFNDPRNLRIIE